MTVAKIEIIGTIRIPDGSPNGEIESLVTNELQADGRLRVLGKVEAIDYAQRGWLWCADPVGGHPVEIVAVDRDHDGRADYVTTKPDHTRANNLLRLKIWDRTRQRWLDWQGRLAA